MPPRKFQMQQAQVVVRGVKEAILTVLRCSPNTDFVASCLLHLKARTVDEAEARLVQHLWTIMHQHLGIEVPAEVAQVISTLPLYHCAPPDDAQLARHDDFSGDEAVAPPGGAVLLQEEFNHAVVDMTSQLSPMYSQRALPAYVEPEEPSQSSNTLVPTRNAHKSSSSGISAGQPGKSNSHLRHSSHDHTQHDSTTHSGCDEQRHLDQEHQSQTISQVLQVSCLHQISEEDSPLLLPRFGPLSCNLYDTEADKHKSDEILGDFEDSGSSSGTHQLITSNIDRAMALISSVMGNKEDASSTMIGAALSELSAVLSQEQTQLNPFLTPTPSSPSQNSQLINAHEFVHGEISAADSSEYLAPRSASGIHITTSYNSSSTGCGMASTEASQESISLLKDLQQEGGGENSTEGDLWEGTSLCGDDSHTEDRTDTPRGDEREGRVDQSAISKFVRPQNSQQIQASSQLEKSVSNVHNLSENTTSCSREIQEQVMDDGEDIIILQTKHAKRDINSVYSSLGDSHANQGMSKSAKLSHVTDQVEDVTHDKCNPENRSVLHCGDKFQETGLSQEQRPSLLQLQDLPHTHNDTTPGNTEPEACEMEIGQDLRHSCQQPLSTSVPSAAVLDTHLVALPEAANNVNQVSFNSQSETIKESNQKASSNCTAADFLQPPTASKNRAPVDLPSCSNNIYENEENDEDSQSLLKGMDFDFLAEVLVNQRSVGEISLLLEGDVNTARTPPRSPSHAGSEGAGIIFSPFSAVAQPSNCNIHDGAGEGDEESETDISQSLPTTEEVKNAPVEGSAGKVNEQNGLCTENSPEHRVCEKSTLLLTTNKNFNEPDHGDASTITHPLSSSVNLHETDTGIRTRKIKIMHKTLSVADTPSFRSERAAGNENTGTYLNCQQKLATTLNKSHKNSNSPGAAGRPPTPGCETEKESPAPSDKLLLQLHHPGSPQSEAPQPAAKVGDPPPEATLSADNLAGSPAQGGGGGGGGGGRSGGDPVIPPDEEPLQFAPPDDSLTDNGRDWQTARHVGGVESCGQIGERSVRENEGGFGESAEVMEVSCDDGDGSDGERNSEETQIGYQNQQGESSQETITIDSSVEIVDSDEEMEEEGEEGEVSAGSGGRVGETLEGSGGGVREQEEASSPEVTRVVVTGAGYCHHPVDVDSEDFFW